MYNSFFCSSPSSIVELLSIYSSPKLKCSLGVSAMSNTENVKEVDGDVPMDGENSSTQKEEEVIKKKYGGIVPKKPPLISKDHERAYFDSADWALGKQGAEKPKGPLEALRPKLKPTQQPTRYRKSPCAPSEGEEASNEPSEEETTTNG